ncbi:hypothetical protein LDENG_00163720 [Lucifuga dentata]|nr:hypothetical protein LDENG_00163720 [Lucifuga dentata]
MITFKALNGLAPNYLKDVLTPYVPRRSLEIDAALLVVPRSQLVLRGDRAFAVRAPKLWNTLPIEVRQATSLATFKSSLKTFF